MLPTFTTIAIPRGDTPATSSLWWGGLLAGSAHVENGDNGGLGFDC
ncbi:hypothetical protein [Xenorhabdus bovienii]|nr:hypothetical protein [Xenorhabdus bovienii]MDE9487504.1 hypothetical protein [Xenorhabdus bovienii]